MGGRAQQAEAAQTQDTSNNKNNGKEERTTDCSGDHEVMAKQVRP